MTVHAPNTTLEKLHRLRAELEDIVRQMLPLQQNYFENRGKKSESLRILQNKTKAKLDEIDKCVANLYLPSFSFTFDEEIKNPDSLLE